MLLTFAALLAGMQTQAEPAPVLLKIDDNCGMVADGKLIPVGELRIHIDRWARENREIRLAFTGKVTASCANDIIVTLSDANVTRFSFFGNEAVAPEKPK
jgi:hypothetical protein